jgi:hypothetical protein
MALIGKTGGQSDFGDWNIGQKHWFACSANAQAMPVPSNTFASESAKNAGNVNGMDANVATQLLESQAFGVLLRRLIDDAAEPRGRHLSEVGRRLSDHAQHFA